jgi:predicted PurR-regulated permease PerM
MAESTQSRSAGGSWQRSRWLRNGLLLPLWFLNGWLLLRLITFLQPFLTIFIFALVLALLLDWPVQLLQRQGLGRSPSVTLVLVVVLSLGSLALALLLPALGDQVGRLMQALPDWVNASSGLTGFLASQPWLSSPAGDGPWLLETISAQIGSLAKDLVTTLPNLLGAGLGAGLFVFLTVVLTVFLLIGGQSAWRGLTRWLPPWWRERIRVELPRRMSLFLRGQVAVAAGFSVVLAVIFSVIRVPFGALFGLVIGAASMVPFMGAVAQVSVSLFLVIHNIGLGVTVFVLAFVLGQIVDNVVVPKVMGRMVGMNPIWLLLTVFLGAKVGGVPGILVSVPIASTLGALADDLWLERGIEPQT